MGVPSGICRLRPPPFELQSDAIKWCGSIGWNRFNYSMSLMLACQLPEEMLDYSRVIYVINCISALVVTTMKRQVMTDRSKPTTIKKSEWKIPKFWIKLCTCHTRTFLNKKFTRIPSWQPSIETRGLYIKLARSDAYYHSLKYFRQMYHFFFFLFYHRLSSPRNAPHRQPVRNSCIIFHLACFLSSDPVLLFR